MTEFLDRAASVFAVVLTLLVCGGPAWLSHLAIRGGLAPVWAYVFVVLLVAIGLILAIAFGRKAARGIAPSRQRRRR